MPLVRSLLFAALLPLSLHAHEVWLEDTPEGKLMVRFAEYGDEFEKSPGALDSLLRPFAYLPAVAAVPAPEEKEKKEDGAGRAPAAERAAIRAGRVETLEVQKQAEGFFLPAADASKAALFETDFTVVGTPGDAEKPARKPNFYARWQPPQAEAGKPGMNLDLVPTGRAGEAGLFFRGKPIANFKVKLYPPAEPEQELTTDESGVVRFAATKPGLYLLAAARYREPLPGYFGGKAFDVVSYNCSLSWRQP